jgi:hypothetical protein
MKHFAVAFAALLLTCPALAGENRLYIPVGFEFAHNSFSDGGTSSPHSSLNDYSATSGIVFISKLGIGVDAAVSLGVPDASKTAIYYRGETNFLYAPLESLYLFGGLAGSSVLVSTGYHDYNGIGEDLGAAYIFRKFRLKAGWEHTAEDFLGLSKTYHTNETTFFVSVSYLFSLLHSSE